MKPTMSMAFPSLSLLLLLLLLTILLLSTTTTSSTLLLPLTHTLSKTQLQPPHHFLKTASTQSAAARQNPTSTLSLPLSPGSDYTLSLPIGSSSPPQSISLYMDTGSDVVWFPCSPFECILCDDENQNKNRNRNHFSFNLTASSTATTLHCTSPHCSSVHSNSPISDLCAMSNCPLESIELSECPVSSSCPAFYYAYGDGSFVAKLHTDRLSLPSLKVVNFTFGCAHTALAEPIGVAGFGRGRLSLPAQLATVNPLIGNQFSYCLISHSFKSDKIRQPSPLILGRRVDPVNAQVTEVNDRVEGLKNKTNKLVYTPMLQNPKHPYFYLVSMTGISIGKKHIPAPASMSKINSNGDGGLVVDSGTTFTMLPSKFYNSVSETFDDSLPKAWKRLSQPESTTGLSHCYHLNDNVLKGAKVKSVPSLTLHYGGNGSSVTLPRRNYFYEFVMEGGDEAKKGKRVGCFMLMDGGDEGEMGGPSGVLGNYFQQGFEVVYDLEKERIGFVKRRCDSLWEELA